MSDNLAEALKSGTECGRYFVGAIYRVTSNACGELRYCYYHGSGNAGLVPISHETLERLGFSHHPSEWTQLQRELIGHVIACGSFDNLHDELDRLGMPCSWETWTDEQRAIIKLAL